MTDFANVNGNILPGEEACISVFDRSFLHGDGVYETLRTYGGRPFLLARHLDRMAYSAGRLAIPLWRGRDLLEAEMNRTLQAAGNPESLIRIVLSRGEGIQAGDPRACPTPPNLVILVRALVPVPERTYREGTAAVVVDTRRNLPASLDPRVKSNNLLNSILAALDASRAGAPEGIMLNPAGDVAESSNANVFLTLNGLLVTPCLDTGILSGITRELVLQLARDHGVPADERRVPRADLGRAQEVFLTSTSRELLPVVRLDGAPVGDGRPGPITRRLHSLYRRITREVPNR
jgi:branched-chain amino acid aminotransferase